MSLRCPRDHTPLREAFVVTSPVQECRSCHGLWTGRETLAALINDRTRSYLYMSPPPGVRPSPVRCPADAAPLVPVRVHGVEVDVCRVCRGVWFDRAELRRVRLERDPDDPDDALGEILADADFDLDAGFFRRVWRWIEEHLPDDWGGAEPDLD